MPLEDTFFGCADTPVQIPKVFKIENLHKCLSCTLRLTANIAGPGNYTPRPEGLTINENPTVTLAFNGIQHSLIETMLTFPGGHRLPDRQEVCPAELFLFFHSVRDANQHICLAIPLDVGAGDSNAYFTTLNNTVQKDRPTVDTVIPKNAKIMSYNGADIRGRTAINPRPRDFCDPVKRIVSYYVCLTSSKIAAEDFNRLKSVNAAAQGIAKPVTDALTSKLTTIASLIEGITLTEEPSTLTGGVSAKALKCFRLDKTRDIVGSTVYVGDEKRPGRTLEDELAGTPVETATDVSGSGGPSVGSIQTGLSIFLGIFFGLLAVSTLIYYVYKFVFKSYLERQDYPPPAPAPAPAPASGSASGAGPSTGGGGGLGAGPIAAVNGPAPPGPPVLDATTGATVAGAAGADEDRAAASASVARERLATVARLAREAREARQARAALAARARARENPAMPGSAGIAINAPVPEPRTRPGTQTARAENVEPNNAVAAANEQVARNRAEADAEFLRLQRMNAMPAPPTARPQIQREVTPPRSGATAVPIARK